MNNEKYINDSLAQFEKLLRQQLDRSEAMKSAKAPKDFAALDTITIGLVGGDGIGPIIMTEARKLLPENLRHLNLNPREYKFLAVYCSNNFNAEDAVEKAGYAERNKARYRAIAYSLLQRKEIIEGIKIYIDTIIQPYRDRLELELLNVYYRRAMYTIDKFYDDYDNEIINHFKYEEEVVFPYIEKLMENNRPNDTQYRIGQFEENHSNINEKLNDLKNIIAKYLDEGYSSPQRFELLNTIYSVENDLRKHSLIENKLLIPLVENLENSHE